MSSTTRTGGMACQLGPRQHDWTHRCSGLTGTVCCCAVQGGLGMLGQAAGRMNVLDFGAGGVTPSPMHPDAEYMDPAGSDIELSP